MQEMTEDEIGELIRTSRLAILGLARGNHAYAFPLFYGFQQGAFYFHSHPGEKDIFIHATEEACLTVVQAVTEDDWASAMAFGHVREVRGDDEERTAQDALSSIPLPPELGTNETGEPARSEEDVTYWRMEPLRVTGRKSVRPPSDEAQDVA